MANKLPSFANPVVWDNHTAYDSLSIVIYDGHAYTSVQDVPAGTLLTNTSYWKPTGNVYILIEDLEISKADKATTLAGYGITDAKISNGTVTLGSNSITPLTAHQSVVNNAPTLAWNTASTVGTIGGTALTVKMPTNPNTNTTYTVSTGDSNGQIKVTPSSGSAYNVNVKGLGSRAYDSTSYLPLTGGTCSGNVNVTKSSGESNMKVTSGSANCYIYANSNNTSGIYTNKGYLIEYQANNLLQIGRTDGGLNLRNGEVGVGNGAFNAYRAVKASAFQVQSSKMVKENIKAISDDEARKLLDVDVVSFDYKENFGGEKNQFGVIAEDTLDKIPFVVSVPENYSEEDFDESKGINQPIMGVDYSKFVPYLIKMIQLQQEEINELKRTRKE